MSETKETDSKKESGGRKRVEEEIDEEKKDEDNEKINVVNAYSCFCIPQ